MSVYWITVGLSEFQQNIAGVFVGAAAEFLLTWRQLLFWATEEYANMEDTMTNNTDSALTGNIYSCWMHVLAEWTSYAGPQSAHVRLLSQNSSVSEV